MSAVVSAGGCGSGARSAPMRLDALVVAAAAAQAHNNLQTVYIECSGRRLGGGARQWGEAGLPPHHAAAHCLLRLHSAHNAPQAVWVLVESARALPAGTPLTLWPDPALAAAAHLPFLTPQHLQVEGEGAIYACDMCGARFPEPFPLKAHLYVGCGPAGGPPSPAAFWARLLQKVSQTVCALPPPLTHILLPLRLPPATAATAGHRCSWCGKVYSRRYGLKIHVRTHTGAKPLRCAHCGRAFADPSNLNKHRRLHTHALPNTHTL